MRPEADQTRPERIVEFVRAFHAEHGFGPSLIEITRGVGLKSKSAVHHHLDRLQTQGRIEWTPRKARSIRIPEIR